MSRIRRNTVALGVSFGTTVILSFLQIKILTNGLDQNTFGLWSALVALGALFGTLSELGLPQVLVRYGAKYDAENRLHRLRTLLFLALGIYGAALVAVVVLILAVGPGVARWVGGESFDRNLLLLAYIALASGTLRAINNATFRGLRSMVAMAGLEIAFAGLVTAGYFILRSRLSVETALLVFLGASLFIAVVGLVVLSGHLRKLTGVSGPDPDASPRAVFGEVSGFWRGAAGAGILLIAIEQLDKPVLAGLSGTAFGLVAVFHVAARLVLFARRMLYIPFQVMLPEVTHKWEGGRRDELARDLRLFTKLELGLGLALVIFLTVFAKSLLRIISTEEFVSGAPVVWVFTGVIPFLCLYQPLTMFLRAVGRVWLAFGADALWLLVYLGVGSALIPAFGLPGFVAGQVVASALVLVYSLVVVKRIGLPRPPVAFFLVRLLLSALVWGAGVAIGWAFPTDPWWLQIPLAVGLALVVNVAIVRGRYLTPQEEARTVSLVAGRGAVGRAVTWMLRWPWGPGGR